MFSVARRSRTINIWPGFVDALASVLLVFIFMLLFFVIAQFYLSGVLAGREAALERLTRNINELAETLALEKERSSHLAEQVASLEARLNATLAEKSELTSQLLMTRQRLEASESLTDELQRALREAQSSLAADKETIRLKLLEIASLQQDIDALRKLRAELETRIGELSSRLERETAALASERDRSKQLEARLAEEQERTLLAQKEIEQRDIRLAELTARVAEQDEALAEERQLSESRRSLIATLNQQIAALRQQIAELSAALELAETKVSEQKVEIAELGKRLNLALAHKVQELNRYRSEFFGRLRDILGDRKDIRIVGDRFVFQSEVLFDTASAELGPNGRKQIAALAKSLLEVAKKIPSDIDWVLRVDGHTDRRPISTPEFPSNWELSTARALAIVRYLIEQGIPAERLIAAGFGEHRPLDRANTPQAWQRNRRIEIKLTLP
ncbi:MAG: peptidoglycan -binding protein [Gammaproteobacteria bacterium]